MAVDMQIESSGLLRWATYLDESGNKIVPTLVDAVNQLGDSLVRNMSLDVAARTGLSYHDIHDMFIVRKATAQNIALEIDASKVVSNDEYELPARSWEMTTSRTWKKGRSDVFREGSLVKVVTKEDDKVCQICQDIAAGGPYEVYEAQKLIPAHGFTCRCILMPYAPIKRIPTTFTGANRTTGAFTVKQLVEMLASETLPVKLDVG